MRPRPYRKVVADLEELFAAKGVTLESSTGGKGSHRTLTFVDARLGQRTPVVLAGSKEISIEVQRRTILYLRRRVEEFSEGHPGRDHNGRVRTILESYFNS